MKERLNYVNVVKLSAVLFILAELALFPFIQLSPARTSEACSYAAIILVALFAVVTLKGERDGHFIRIGILFTLVADYFLVLSDDAELEGVIAFIFVQAAYCAYLLVREARKRVIWANIFARVALSAALIAAAFIVLGKDTDALAIASVLYYGNLVVNAVFAFILGREERVFAIGLVLFAMCDLCIGLEVLFSSYLGSSALSFFYGAHLNLPWVFYQPSQVLIGLRLYKKVK